MLRMSLKRCSLPTLAGLALFLCCLLQAQAGLPKLPKAPTLPTAPAAPSGGNAADPSRWLNSADELVAQLQGATDCLERSRGALFSLAATAEEKRLLQSMQEETAATSDDVVEKTRQYQAEVVEQAKAEKRYEAKRLDATQTANLGRLGANLLLAVARDRQALVAGKSLLSDADNVMKAAGEPRNALKLGADAGRLTAMPARLNQALGGVPGQITALDALLGAVEQTRRSNPVELKPAPAGGGSYETVEDF